MDSGLLTPHQLRSANWISPTYGVYADARLERDHALRCHAVLLRLPAGTTIAGLSAAWLHGVEFAATYDDDVHIIAPATTRLRDTRGIRIHHCRLTPADITEQQRLRCTTASRTAWDLAQWLEPVDAVPVIDQLLRLGATSHPELDALLAAHAGSRGHRRAARTFGLADADAQSAPESRLRVRLVLAGLPRPVTQYPVRLRSGLLLHPDLAWPEYRVAAEYDGEWHADADQFHHDRRRLNHLASGGWLVLHVTSRRMRHLATVVAEIRQALCERGWRPPPGPAPTEGRRRQPPRPTGSRHPKHR